MEDLVRHSSKRDHPVAELTSGSSAVEHARKCVCAGHLPIWRNRWLGLAVGLALPLLTFSTHGWAQPGAPASAPPTLPSNGDFTNNPVSLAIVPFITWFGFLVGVIAGVLFFVYRRRRLMPYALQGGALVAVVIALSTQFAVSATRLDAEQKDCRSADFGEENTSERAITCGSARERAANAFGLVSIYAEGTQAGAERNRPISAQVLSLIDLGSLALATLLGYGLVVLAVLQFRRQTIEL